MTKKLMRLFFEEFWEVLPLDWQMGVHAALRGGAFRGDFKDSAADDTPVLVCFFVHPSLAGRVEKALGGRK